ncbi:MULTISPECIES: hypothetical protein [unclassified Sphingomonas]|uniref:hypothetical protein n=1 Tax=unclassified Sphingomonas TaxID=196159 RepID=UPI0006FA4504|nr:MULTISPECIES: hypothetical protein [unclassified Sphingomonas]KQX22682.1 hypothetical protein ASD17_05170 [Sphingomonas sp. Root1294]KQY67838.1 hypothetical protein ASD39_07955 [Sphingomonas sp. Root50]KRB88762.1 hypothetical protein ASE22_20305 [Sphingomonas sp. Root720]
MNIRVSTIGLWSVFRFGYLASLCIFLPISTVFGISALFGGKGVYSNGQPIYGIGALLLAILLGFVFPLFGAAILWLGTAVLRLAEDRAPLLQIKSED